MDILNNALGRVGSATLLTILTATLLTALTVSTAEAATYKRCKNPTIKLDGETVPRTENLRVRRSSCKTARRVVKIVGNTGSTTPLGYSCNPDSHVVVCIKDNRTIRWEWPKY